MSSVITREQLLQQPQNQYMSPDQLAFFRNYLHDLVRETLDRIDTLKLSLTESVTAPDVSDQASLEQIRSNNMRFLQVQQTNLQALRAAIKRIDDEDYGFVNSQVRRLVFSAFSFRRLRPCQLMRNLSSSGRTNTELLNSNSQR